MKILLLLALLLSTTLTAQPFTLDVAELQQGFDELLAHHTAEDNFRGRVIINHGGETIYAKDNGFANFTTQRPYTDTTRFAIGSVTKSFTAAAILLLEQDGKLNLEDPVADYLPELARFPKVTIEHLLTHAGGLPYAMTDIRRVMKLKKGEENNLSITLKRIEQEYIEPGFAAGEKVRYSNIGYDVLAALVEKLSGDLFANFVESRIFAPLQMSTAEVRPSTVLNDQEGYAVPRILTWKGRKEKKFSYSFDAEYFAEPCPARGAYGIYMSSSDLIKVRQLWGSDLLLSEKNRAAYLAPSKMIDGEPNNWRYGCISLVTPHLDSRNITMAGHQPGFISFVIFYPEYDLTIAMLSNSCPMESRYMIAPEIINHYHEIVPILYRAFNVEVPEKETEK